jgi:hypothetical protein
MNTSAQIATIARALSPQAARNEPKVRLAVESITSNHVIGSFLVTEGASVIDVWESEVGLFLAEVEDAALVRAAEQRLAAYEAMIRRKRAGEHVPDTSLPRYPLSLPAVFRELHGRDIRPLRRVERVEDRQQQKSR